MHILLQRVVREIIGKGGVLDPIEDFADLQALDRLARLNCGEHDPAKQVSALEQGIPVGNVMLYRLSWGALEWISGPSSEWWPTGHPLAGVSMAYAMAHSRRPSAFKGRMASDKRYATSVIKRWIKHTTCSLEALLKAVNALTIKKPDHEPVATKHQEPTTTNQEPHPHIPIVARLQQEFGQTENYWLFSGPFEKVISYTDVLRRQDEAAERGNRKMQGGIYVRDPDAPEQRHFYNWRAACKKFEDKVITRTNQQRESSAHHPEDY